VLAPVFDVLRYDLPAGHAWLLGFEWHAGLDDLLCVSKVAALGAIGRIFGRVILPVFALGGLLMWAAWRWGRLYCGWLCPHFWVVELINECMRRAGGRPTLWEPRPCPCSGPTAGRSCRIAAGGWRRRCWRWAVRWCGPSSPSPMCCRLPRCMATCWRGARRGEGIFIAVFTGLLALEFFFARHLFCRFACSVGVFQSLAWMANRAALVVGFRRERGAECAACDSACDHACPMRLRPRNIKRAMFTCTQCGLCVAACETTQRDNPRGPFSIGLTGRRRGTTRPPSARRDSKGTSCDCLQ
jgi:polyferredoxin